MNKLLTTNLRWLLLSLLLTTGVGSAWGQTTDTYTFTSKAWAANPANWTSGKDGNQMTSGRGVQVTTGASGANGTSPTSFSNVSQVVVTYSTNANAGAGSIAIQVGSNTAVSQNVTKTGGTTDRTLTYTFSPLQSGKVKITVTCTTNSIYVKSVAITYGSTPKTETEVTFPQESYDTSIPGTFSAPTATVRNKNTAATISGATVSYESSNTTVATVNANTGAVTLVGIGSTTISANYAGNNTYSSSSGSYTLTVEDGRPTTSVSFLQDSYEAVMGQPFTSPTATLTPSGAGSLTYSSSNESVATVNSSTGEVTIAAAGSTMITASFEGNSNYKGSSATYTLVISDASSSTTGYSLYTGTLTEGDYIIYYNGKAMKASVSSNRLGYESVTPTNDVIETTESSIIWHIAQSGSYWTIYNAGTGKYAAANGTKNQAQLLESGTDDKSLWTVSGSSTYEFVNKSNAANNVNSNLRNNENYGFACYSTSTGGALSLYRYTSSETPESVSAPSLTAECSFWPNTTESPSKTITIAPVSEGSYVRYTTNGSDPTTSSGNLLTSSTDITINATTTVKAIAYYSDDVKSSVVSATYTLGQTVNSIADFKALDNETEARLYLSPEQNARVLHYSGNEIYLPVAINADEFDDYKADWVTISDLRTTGSGNNITGTNGANNFKVYNKYNLNNESYYQDPYDGALVDLTGLAVPYNSTKEIVPIYYNDARPIVYVIDENEEFTSPNENIQDATVRLVRTLSNSNWNTFVIPIDLPYLDGSIRLYDHADGTTMVFAEDYIEAGKPYLVKPYERIENPVYTNVTLSATSAQNVEEGGYSFNAIYSPTNIYSADRTNRFLKSDGYLYYPTDEDAGRLKGMRAYFVVPAGASNIKVNPDGTATAIDDLIIMNDLRDNKVYDVSGRMVSNDLRSLPRGIYIVNGKKIVVR